MRLDPRVVLRHLRRADPRSVRGGGGGGRWPGCRVEASTARCLLHGRSPTGRPPCRCEADDGRRRPADHQGRPAGHPAVRFPAARPPSRPCSSPIGPRWPRTVREFSGTLPLRGCRAQGRGRRQRRHPLLHDRPPGTRRGRPLILQAKEATASASWEPYAAPGRHDNHGERVVHGQRVMQATPDIFLGWCRSAAGRDFYFRQLWDMKGSVDITQLRPDGLSFLGGLCGWALATAHARSGDAVAMTAPISARVTRSTARSPTSPKPMPTRTSGTTPTSWRRSQPAA